MRKLLLATTAALVASIGGAGIAQAQITTIPTLVPGTSPFGPATPAPGTVIVRLGGKVFFFAGEASETADKVTVPAAANVIGTASGTSAVPAGTYKQQNYFFGNTIYLYPSVDGVAANGLQYGAFIELRDENYTPSGGGGGNGGITNLSGGTSSSASGRSNYVYVRRSYAYLGSPQFGTVRVGVSDGPTGLFETGTFENFNDGGWNGEVVDMLSMDNGTHTMWPFSGGTGAAYDTDKIVYLSPQFYGFDFGVSYEPNSSGANDYNGGYGLGLNSTGTGIANSGSGSPNPGTDRLSSTPVASEYGRRKNTVEFDSRYRGSFGPVGVALEAGFMGSQHLGASNAGGVRYNGLEIGQFGAVATFGGLSVGGHIMYGNYNDQFVLKPVGATPAFAYIVGASYSVGPLIVGASFDQINNAGSSGPLGTAVATVGQYRARGVAVGSTYTLAPGVSLFTSYVYGDQKENGVNLVGDSTTIAGPGGNNLAHNQVRGQGLFAGTFVRW